MSVHKPTLVVTRRAQRDLRGILRYTTKTWGNRQRVDYEAVLDRALATILEHAEIGKNRDDLRTGQRSFPVGEHIFFYRIIGTTLRVDRVLHAKMDARTQLGV
jgi:toxin ParE1/3/4